MKTTKRLIGTAFSVALLGGLSAGLPTAASATSIPPRIVKAGYSDRIYEITYSEAGATTRWLGWEEWKAKGFPQPATMLYLPATDFIKMKHDDRIFAFKDDEVVHLTFEQWAATGYQKPHEWAEDYVKYTWSDSIYAVSFTAHVDRQQNWLWRHVPFAQWQQLGYPQPRIAGWIAGTEIFSKYDGPDIYARLDGVEHKLTFQEWVAAGRPELPYSSE